MKKMVLPISMLAFSMMPFLASADEVKAAQVYDVKITVKTTGAVQGRLSSKKNPFVDDSSEIVYRKQASQKWAGLIWGCDCESIRGIWQSYEGGGVSGCVIWNTKSPYGIIFDEDIKWRLLNAIDATGTKCEGSWTIGDSSDDSRAFLAFSGFGLLTLSTFKKDDVLVLTDCMSNVKSMSGNVAGWMPAPSLVRRGKPGKCTFCGVVDPGEEDTEDLATAWNFCECADEIGDNEFTAVSGTWSIKFNTQLSNKLRSSDSILSVYTKFPENVKEVVATKIAELSE